MEGVQTPGGVGGGVYHPPSDFSSTSMRRGGGEGRSGMPLPPLGERVPDPPPPHTSLGGEGIMMFFSWAGDYKGGISGFRDSGISHPHPPTGPPVWLPEDLSTEPAWAQDLYHAIQDGERGLASGRTSVLSPPVGWGAERRVWGVPIRCRDFERCCRLATCSFPSRRKTTITARRENLVFV